MVVNKFLAKILTTIITCLCSLGHAQGEAKDLEFSMSVGIGYYTEVSDVSSISGNTGGFNINADLGLELDDYLFSLVYGSSLGSLGPNEEGYHELGFTMGIYFVKHKQFTMDGHIGLSYFVGTNRYFNSKISEPSIGLPIRIKAHHFISDHLGIGGNLHGNVNGIFPIIGINFSILYKI